MNNKRHSTNEQLSLDEINNTIKFDHRSSNKQKFLSFSWSWVISRCWLHGSRKLDNINARWRAIWLYFAIRNSYFKFISNVTSKA